MSLTIDDFANPFNIQAPIHKTITGENGLQEEVIVGEIISSNFHNICFTYYISTELAKFNYFDKPENKNIQLLSQKIKSVGDFEKSLAKADKKIYYYLVKN